MVSILSQSFSNKSKQFSEQRNTKKISVGVLILDQLKERFWPRKVENTVFLKDHFLILPLKLSQFSLELHCGPVLGMPFGLF